MEVPDAIDTEAESFFADRGTAAVFDFGSKGGTVAVQGLSKGFDVFLGSALEAINAAGGDGEVGGLGSSLPQLRVCNWPSISEKTPCKNPQRGPVIPEPGGGTTTTVPARPGSRTFRAFPHLQQPATQSET
jgi:hypothetical protein